jgi:prepilin-type processing-associated H-X9-DG protein
MRPPSTRHRVIVISAIASLLIAFVAIKWRSHQRTRCGFTLTRHADETIRISWGTPSGMNISPRSTMQFCLGHQLESRDAGELPVLSELQDVWMYDLQPEIMGSAVPASYINPLNDDAFNHMFEMMRLCKGGKTNAERMTRIAAHNYTYLGFVVRNHDDVQSLTTALSNRAGVRLDKDISTPNGILYRISPGVEKHLAKDPNDMNELKELRHVIPVMFELLDRKAGHPCNLMNVLYLDGHIECIPFGAKFPATQTFVDAFPAPRLSP